MGECFEEEEEEGGRTSRRRSGCNTKNKRPTRQCGEKAPVFLFLFPRYRVVREYVKRGTFHRKSNVKLDFPSACSTHSHAQYGYDQQELAY